MKIGFYDEFRPCLVKENGVIDLSGEVGHLPAGDSPQLLLEKIILNWDALRPRFQEMWQSAPITASLQQVRLRAPVPRPGKVLMGQGNFMEGVKIEPPRPLSTFFKSPDAVIGDGETVVLPSFRPVIFNHEAELAVVIGRPAKQVSESDALSHVFGYTTGVDVSARAPEEGEAGLAGNYGKCFDTFLPIGPAITTADEITNPNHLRVRYWINEQPRQDYNTSDMEHSVAYMISTLSWNMTLKPGDLIMCGTNHGNLGPMQDGDLGEIEIEKVGRSHHRVVDELKRTWDPKVLRDPALNAANRERAKEQPNSGTWPYQARGGQPRRP
jgi:2-keto-4-pentenoate hydratase/2-oxohepta-3-ene-1,7-dioic acid hydratase in catechol pathway